MDEIAMSRSSGPGFDRMKSELTSVILEQQAEHEKRITDILVAHQQHFMEAMRAELARVALIGEVDAISGRTPVGRSTTPEIVSVMVTSHETGGVLGGVPRRQQNRKHSLTQGLPAVHTESTTGPPAASNQVARRAMESHTQQFNADLQVHRASALEHSFNTRIGKVIQSPIFECIVCASVVLNAISIGCEADWTMRNLYKRDDEPVIFRVLEISFSAAFLAELILRIIGEGWHFLAHTNRNRPWNILDTLLVIAVVVDELSRLLISMTHLRPLRMVYTVRVIRIIRITRFFTDLRVMVKGLICAARSLFWVIVLLFSVIYMFAVCLMQLTADSIAAKGKPPKIDPSTDDILMHVGSVVDAMYALYKSVTGGMEWGVLADLLAEQGVLLAVVYSVYIAFAMLCVLNIVTGVFVQNASTIANNDQIEMGLEHLERRRAWMKEVIELFKTTDMKGSGQIDWKTFSACLNKPSVQACFSQLGINLEAISSRGLFCLFDINDDGTIDLEEFVHGIVKLHGTARSFDLHRVGNDSKKILQQVQEMTTRLP